MTRRSDRCVHRSDLAWPGDQGRTGFKLGSYINGKEVTNPVLALKVLHLSTPFRSNQSQTAGPPEAVLSRIQNEE